MHSQQYKDRVRIERKGAGTDPDYGTPVANAVWIEVVTVYAQVQDVLPSRAESQDNPIRIEKSPARIRMRYRTGITSDMRMVQLNRDNRVLQITAGPAVLGCKEGLEFMAEEYSTEGRA